MGKVQIGKNAKVNIKWKVRPIDRTEEAENSIKAEFAKKYGISEKNISIEPIYININSNGDEEPFTNELIDNIQEPRFQQELFRKYMAEREYTDYNFDEILEIDDLINNSIDYEVYDKHKKYSINWIKWSNFMSYGPDNFIDLTKLKGLVLLTSEPANQGGKSTFCLDLFRFLLFGKVTSREDDWTLARAFNDHIPEATEVVVEGSITIDGTEYIINRTLTRPSLNKRTAKSRVTQTIKYYKKIDNILVDIADEDNLNESTTTETNKAIKEAIGNERDFDLMICVDRRNLEGLISLKDTERGRLISRWIGLLPLEEKDKIARETFNKSISPKLLLNKLDKTEIEKKIEENKDTIKENNTRIKDSTGKADECTAKIEKFTQEKDALLSSKKEIDDSLLKVDVETVRVAIERITEQGKAKKAEKERNENAYKELGDVDFSENEYNETERKRDEYFIRLNTGISSCNTLKKDIEALKKGEFCPTCGAKLKNVDNTEKIAEKEKEYECLVTEGKENRKKYDEYKEKVELLKEKQKKYNEKTKLGLIIDKNEVDIENLRSRLRENTRLMKDIETNRAAIENNNKIEIALNNIKVNISTEETCRRRYEQDINTLTANNKTLAEQNTEYRKTIKKIEEEEKLVRNWKLYLEMVGKNGISKMVLRNVLPLINGELNYLLNGVCDFQVEVDIDDHNDVAFYQIHDNARRKLSAGSGMEQTVASLALRSVLGKISSFSKPSFIVFDEILGGIADENYDNVKLLYDKIIANYQYILEITHLKNIADWHTKTIIVKKENNISKIETA